MLKLETITDLTSDDLDLLEAAGWVTPHMLAKSETEEVFAEIEKANGILKLVREVPSRDVVAGWISEAREMTGFVPEEVETVAVLEAPKPTEAKEAETGSKAVGRETAKWGAEDVADKDVDSDEGSPVPVVNGPVNFEADPEVAEMLNLAPVALPIPNRLLAERGISPGDIAIAPVLNRAESDLEVRVTTRERKQKPRASQSSPKGLHAGVNRVADPVAAEKRELDTSKVRVMERSEQDDGEHPYMHKRRQSRDERLTLLRTTKESTNRGRKPGTRRYIRGVLHDRPVRVWFGCLIVILFQITVPLSIISALLLIVTEHSPNKLAWVPSWIIAFPLALPILGILYFTISFNVKCRVCGQKVLVHRHCRKNRKAHHIYGLGYVLPLAVQTLLFLWFNCTFCGTSIRIKE